jgi:hypothetical protein
MSAKKDYIVEVLVKFPMNVKEGYEQYGTAEELIREAVTTEFKAQFRPTVHFEIVKVEEATVVNGKR